MTFASLEMIEKMSLLSFDLLKFVILIDTIHLYFVILKLMVFFVFLKL